MHQPKSVRLQERKSTYCSAIWTLMKAASRHKKKYRVSATLRDGSLWIPQGRMCPKEIYSVLMQEFAGFCKTSVDVRYWLILSVSTGSNAGRRGRNRSSSQSVYNKRIIWRSSLSEVLQNTGECRSGHVCRFSGTGTFCILGTAYFSGRRIQQHAVAAWQGSVVVMTGLCLRKNDAIII